MPPTTPRPSPEARPATRAPARPAPVRREDLGDAYDATEFVWTAASGTSFVGSTVAAGGAVRRPDDLPPRYHVLTAWNPDSKPLSAVENRRRNVALLRGLRQEARRTRPILGREPPTTGRAWAEASFVVEGLSRADAVRWGRTSGQVAVFEVVGDVRSVIFCGTGTARRGRRLRWTRAPAGPRVRAK